METYEGRSLQEVIVAKVEVSNGFTSITSEDGTGFGFGPELNVEIEVGGSYLLETKNYSLVTGLIGPDGDWLVRRSDQEMDRRHREQVKASEEKHRKSVVDGAGDMILRTLNLPAEFREEMLNALKGDDFAFGFMGWGYILVTFELVGVMDEFGVDSEEAERFMSDHGMSGNQVGMAKSIAVGKDNRGI